MTFKSKSRQRRIVLLGMLGKNEYTPRSILCGQIDAIKVFPANSSSNTYIIAGVHKSSRFGFWNFWHRLISVILNILRCSQIINSSRHASPIYNFSRTNRLDEIVMLHLTKKSFVAYENLYFISICTNINYCKCL